MKESTFSSELNQDSKNRCQKEKEKETVMEMMENDSDDDDFHYSKSEINPDKQQSSGKRKNTLIDLNQKNRINKLPEIKKSLKNSSFASDISNIIQHFTVLKRTFRNLNIRIANLISINKTLLNYFNSPTNEETDKFINIIDLIIQLEAESQLKNNTKKDCEIDKEEINLKINSYINTVTQSLLDIKQKYDIDILNLEKDKIEEIIKKSKQSTPLIQKIFFRKSTSRKKEIFQLFTLFEKIIIFKSLWIDKEKNKILSMNEKLNPDSSIDDFETMLKQIFNFRQLIQTTSTGKKLEVLTKDFKLFYEPLTQTHSSNFSSTVIDRYNSLKWNTISQNFLSHFINKLWLNYQNFSENNNSEEPSKLSKTIISIFQILRKLFQEYYKSSEKEKNLPDESSADYKLDAQDIQIENDIFIFLNKRQPENFNIEDIIKKIKSNSAIKKSSAIDDAIYTNAINILSLINNPQKNEKHDPQFYSFIYKKINIDETIDEKGKRDNIVITIESNLLSNTLINELKSIKIIDSKIEVSKDMDGAQKKLLGLVLFLYFFEENKKYVFDHISKNREISVVIKNNENEILNISFQLVHTITAFYDSLGRLLFISEEKLLGEGASDNPGRVFDMDYSMMSIPVCQNHIIQDIETRIRKIDGIAHKKIKRPISFINNRFKYDTSFFVQSYKDWKKNNYSKLYKKLNPKENPNLEEKDKNFIKWIIQKKINSPAPLSPYPNHHAKSDHLPLVKYSGENLENFLDNLRKQNKNVIDVLGTENTVKLFYKIIKSIVKTLEKNGLIFHGDIDARNILINIKSKKIEAQIIDLANAQPKGTNFFDYFNFYLEGKGPKHIYDWYNIVLQMSQIAQNHENPYMVIENADNIAFLRVCCACLDPMILITRNETKHDMSSNFEEFSNELFALYQEIINNHQFFKIPKFQKLQHLFSSINDKDPTKRPSLQTIAHELKNICKSKSSPHSKIFHDPNVLHIKEEEDGFQRDTSNYKPKGYQNTTSP